jgi:hypothetical protein
MRAKLAIAALTALTLAAFPDEFAPRSPRFRDDEPEPRPPRRERAPNAPRNSSREEARRRRQRERAK